MKPSIAIVGSGQVGVSLGIGLTRHGYNVTLASREVKEVVGWVGEIGKSSEVVETADIIILAQKGSVVESVVKGFGKKLKGKTVIDVTNPIADKPAVNGVLQYFTTLNESLLERLQRAVPEANFVKAFNSVGNAYFVDPPFSEKPTMFICGNDDKAKKEVQTILEDVGWEVEDMGKVEAARAIEPLCMLWCIPGLLRNDWSPRAFKLLKK